MPDLKAELIATLHALGFELAGVTRPDPSPHLTTYLDWIQAGRHAGMAYLATPRALHRRSDLREILPEVRSVVVVGLRYANPAHSLPGDPQPDEGRVAAYAWGQDYHEIIPPRLEQAAHFLTQRLGRSLGWRAYSDTGPLLERDLAMAAGLGWIGKNTCLIAPRHGSYFLLGVLLLDEPFDPDPPFQADQCGSCRRCIEACPTACIREDRTLDAARCIAYQTIENKGAIPEELRERMGTWLFGCDVCQQVCPWNLRFASPHGDPQLAPTALPGEGAPALRDELRLDPQTFNRKFKGRALQRPRRRGYLRNVTVTLGNRADPADLPALADCLTYEAEPLVRAHAAWALGRFRRPEALTALQVALMQEDDPVVRAEIMRALHRPA
jgi:epoxyqueuosine reductase